jgi:hypothetical protein
VTDVTILVLRWAAAETVAVLGAHLYRWTMY